MIKRAKNGQVALIILLIMVVVLTIGLSLISHSITDISISKDEEEANRAFSAAEAGVEAILSKGSLTGGATYTFGSSDVPIPSAAGSVTVTGKNELSQELAPGEFLNVDLTGLTGHAQVKVTLNWTNGAALEVTIYQDNLGTRSFALLPTTGSTCYTYNFTAADPPYDIFVSGDDSFMRIRALCNSSTVAVSAVGGGLPLQAYGIKSQATIGGEKESKTSVIEVTRSVAGAPSIFDYVVFAQGSIIAQPRPK